MKTKTFKTGKALLKFIESLPDNVKFVASFNLPNKGDFSIKYVLTSNETGVGDEY